MFRNFDFTLRQLQYAVAVAETGVFGEAAELCGVSQPALSAQVAKLEDTLGVRLFERHPRGVHVTAAGRELLPRMRAALEAGRAVEEAAQAWTDPYGIPLRVGVIPTVAPYLLPSVVERLQERSPAPTVHWLERQTGACERALAAGELDAMVIADRPTLSGVDDVELGWEPFYVVVPPDHPLAGEVTLEDVAANEVLLLEDGHCLRDHAMALCMKPGARESPYRATSLSTLVQMVASGLGISVLPANAVPVEARRARVRVVPFAASGVGRTVRMAWRSRSPLAGLLVEVADVMRDALQASVRQVAQSAA